MKIGKRVLSALIAIVMMIGMLPATSFAVETNDYENSWAKNEINYMKEKGIFSGYPDGTFKPTNNMSKSEFYKVINGLMGYSEKAENKFLDVTQSDWYYEEVLKGLKANYLQPGELLNARDNITRGEVARIISVVFGIEESPSAVEAFADNLIFPEELRGVIGGLKKNGFINGFPDGTFRPYAEITRAEVVKMLHSISGEIVNVAGTVSKDISTNLVVNTGDVLLKDMTIAGNLYLTEGIGEGDVTLDNVVVKGELSIKGGGTNSVIIKNSKINTVSVDKQSGLVRVVFENTTVEEVKTNNEVKIELTNGTVIKVVELDGKVEVAVEKGAAIVYIDVVSNEIIIDSKGTIESIKTTGAIKINGTTVKANSEYKVEEGKSTEVKPTETKPTHPSSDGSSGGGSSGGSSGGGGAGPVSPVIKIHSHPAVKTTVTEGSINGNLAVVATATQNAVISYQWYSATAADKTGATMVAGETNATFVISTDLAEGDYYYFCRVSAPEAQVVDSNVSTITVEAVPQDQVYNIGDTVMIGSTEITVTEVYTTKLVNDGSTAIAGDGEVFYGIKLTVLTPNQPYEGRYWYPNGFVSHILAADGVRYGGQFSDGKDNIYPNQKTSVTVYFTIKQGDAIDSIIVTDGQGNNETVSVK